MNFYSDIIINNIIDNEKLETLIESIEKLGEDFIEEAKSLGVNIKKTTEINL
jgi:hypothetical protein